MPAFRYDDFLLPPLRREPLEPGSQEEQLFKAIRRTLEALGYRLSEGTDDLYGASFEHPDGRYVTVAWRDLTDFGTVDLTDDCLDDRPVVAEAVCDATRWPSWTDQYRTAMRDRGA